MKKKDWIRGSLLNRLWIIWGIIFAFIMSFTPFCVIQYLTEKPLVIFAGGGSVKNYLQDKGILLDNSNPDSLPVPKSVYINIPSEYGWTLLKEEMVRFKGKGPDGHSFLYICLSADAISSEEINAIYNNCGEDSSQIYGLGIGDDTLIIYHNDKEISDSCDKNSCISDSCFRKLLRNHSKIYATSRKSGTRRVYERILKDSSILSNSPLYYDTEIIDTNSIILGGRFYYPNNKGKFRQTKLKQKGSDTIYKKNMFVYFVAYKDGSKFKLNKQIGIFLEKISGFIDGIDEDTIKKWEEKLPDRGSSTEKIIYLPK